MVKIQLRETFPGRKMLRKEAKARMHMAHEDFHSVGLRANRLIWRRKGVQVHGGNQVRRELKRKIVNSFFKIGFLSS